MDDQPNPYQSPQEPAGVAPAEPVVLKSPWVAGVLNFLVPGLGFAHLGMTAVGWLNFLGMFVFACAWPVVYWIYNLVSVLAVVVGGSLRNARLLKSTDGCVIVAPRQAWVAALTNLVVPGFGLAYLDLPIAAALNFAAFAALVGYVVTRQTRPENVAPAIPLFMLISAFLALVLGGLQKERREAEKAEQPRLGQEAATDEHG
jgi:hypothetical protein